MSSEPASLRRGFAQGSDRFFLGDRPLSGGDILELCCSGGWLAGRFEWTPLPEPSAYFHFSIELGGGEVAEQRIALPERALLRLHT